ncbi:LytTR family transcriptional regulator DNA-binding domain-containing protein [Psychromonas sp. SP041]|uniref:LytTR family transcriptional regulator DNA-binding domain-containing protein n=1 Tax=Psychromonas sp. SP041 TaxID=1365007 RepID=UPI0010C7C3CA|nr:LytTR family transcriptional regulator DNA-binding domain-containing protein [Psychromonas sp. SP041]
MVEINLKKILKKLKALNKESLTHKGEEALLKIQQYAEEILEKDVLSVTAKSMDGKQSFTINVCEPHMVSTDGRNIILHIAGRERLLVTKISLKSLEEKWKCYFTRISRTSLVANSAIKSVQRTDSGYIVELSTGDNLYGTISLDISRRSFYIIRSSL